MFLIPFFSTAILKTNIPPFRVYSTKIQLSLFNSWEQFYSKSEYEVVSQESFKDKQNNFYMDQKKYYLQNIKVQNLQTNAIFIENKERVYAIIESCKFINIITSIPTSQRPHYGLTRTGAIFYESQNGDCVISKCSAYKCYNSIANPNYDYYYYYDGGQFATIWHAQNQIHVTSIESCADQPNGVSPFKSLGSLGKYAGINISNCKSVDSSLFAVFPDESDYIKYSLFDGNSGNIVHSRGICVLFFGKFTIKQCIFTNNSVDILIYTTHSANAVVEKCVFFTNHNVYLSYADIEEDHGYSTILIKNCYFENTKTRNVALNADGAAASISFDKINNASIKDYVISNVIDGLQPKIYSKEVPYFGKDRKIHVHH